MSTGHALTPALSQRERGPSSERELLDGTCLGKCGIIPVRPSLNTIGLRPFELY
jgi:hypothetical protein